MAICFRDGSDGNGIGQTCSNHLSANASRKKQTKSKKKWGMVNKLIHCWAVSHYESWPSCSELSQSVSKPISVRPKYFCRKSHPSSSNKWSLISLEAPSSRPGNTQQPQFLVYNVNFKTYENLRSTPCGFRGCLWLLFLPAHWFLLKHCKNTSSDEKDAHRQMIENRRINSSTSIRN